jgi:hypothetical protein
MRPRRAGDSGFNGSVTVSMSSPASTGMSYNPMTWLWVTNSIFPFPPIDRNTCPTSGDAWSGRYWIGNYCDEIGKRFLNRPRARKCLKWRRCPWRCGCSITGGYIYCNHNLLCISKQRSLFQLGGCSHLQMITLKCSRQSLPSSEVGPTSATAYIFVTGYFCKLLRSIVRRELGDVMTVNTFYFSSLWSTPLTWFNKLVKWENRVRDAVTFFALYRETHIW